MRYILYIFKMLSLQNEKVDVAAKFIIIHNFIYLILSLIQELFLLSLYHTNQQTVQSIPGFC